MRFDEFFGWAQDVREKLSETGSERLSRFDEEMLMFTGDLCQVAGFGQALVEAKWSQRLSLVMGGFFRLVDPLASARTSARAIQRRYMDVVGIF